MINGIPVTGPLTYFYQKDMIGGSPAEKEFKVEYENPTGIKNIIIQPTGIIIPSIF